MRKSEHITARVLTLMGAVASVLYLGWRLAFSFEGASVGLSALLLAAEVVGFAGTALLTWALWPAPQARRTGAVAAVDGPVDVVVRVVDQELHEIRATLLSLRAVENAGDVLVVDHTGRPEVVTLAAEFQCMYAATDLDDANGLRVMQAAVRTSEFLLLDAGDVEEGLQAAAAGLHPLRHGLTPGDGERLFLIGNAPATGDTHTFDSTEIEQCRSRMFQTLARCGLEIRCTPASTIATTPSWLLASSMSLRWFIRSATVVARVSGSSDPPLAALPAKSAAMRSFAPS